MSKAPEKANIKPQRVKGNGGIYIMGLAERVYNNNKIKRNKNRTESPDDKAYRLARMYNRSKISRNYWLFEPKCRNNAEITYTQRLQIASYFP